MLLDVCIVLIIIIIGLIIFIYQKTRNAICTSKKRLDGKTVIVTGGTSGIGLETAIDLADRGARVIIACPFEKEGEEALKLITEKTENNNVVFKLLDLSSLASTRKFAAEILDTEERLDILINNAGVGAIDGITADGISTVMQVNYFGPFLLTLLLLPLLNKTGTITEPARIVNVSSITHKHAYIKLDKITDSSYWLRSQSYGNSKLCVILFAHELNKRLERNVIINSIDPGFVGTSIFVKSETVLGIFLVIIAFLFFKTPWYGAQTTIYAAVSRQAGKVSGQYFKNCQLSRAQLPIYSDKLAEKLWNKSVSVVKLGDEELKQCFSK